MKRRQMTRKKSKKYFTKNAQKVNKKNFHVPPMRGGYRL